MCPQPTSEGINNLGCFLDKMKWHEMKRGSELMMTWVTIVPENEVSDAPEIFYPLPLGKTSTEKKRQLGPLFLRQKRRFARLTGKKI